MALKIGTKVRIDGVGDERLDGTTGTIVDIDGVGMFEVELDARIEFAGNVVDFMRFEEEDLEEL